MEIRQIARADPVLAADGAVVLLEKLSPALEQVDRSTDQRIVLDCSYHAFNGASHGYPFHTGHDSR